MSSTGGVDFGDLDVTFSAPFYTGIFLSSRRLQGKYGDHQEIVADYMNKNCKDVWTYPKLGCESWKGTVSPSHFIECNLSKKCNSQECLLKKLCEKLKKLHKKQSLNLSDLEVSLLNIKFYEFALGSVSIKVTGVKLSQSVKNAGKKLLTEFEEEVRTILNCIANKATKVYSNAVPCCIKNIDMFDIDNFNRLEGDNGEHDSDAALYKTNAVEVLDIHKFVEIESKKSFSDYSRLLQFFPVSREEMKRLPFYGRLSLFSSDKGDITVAIADDEAKNKVDKLIMVSEAMGVYGALGKYFSNFLNSYYNYSARQYELIDAPGMYSMRKRFKTRGFLEKFADIQILYSQSIFVMKQNKNIYFSADQTKFWDAKNLYLKIDKVWENNDKQIEKLQNWYQQVSNISEHVSIISSADFSLVAILFSLLIAGVLFVGNSIYYSADMITEISFEIQDTFGKKMNVDINDVSIEFEDGNWSQNFKSWIQERDLIILFSVLLSFVIFAFVILPNFARTRKQNSLSKSQKKNLRKEYNENIKKNKKYFKQMRNTKCQNNIDCHVCK